MDCSCCVACSHHAVARPDDARAEHEAAAHAVLQADVCAPRVVFKGSVRVGELACRVSRGCGGGYGVELDVQLTRDKQVVVFHDDDLKRACGIDARVDAYSYDELQTLSLFGTQERIPLFTDVLSTIDGKIPMIVELKSGGDWKTLCPKTLELLQAYKGDYCVESFHPLLVRWFYLHAPQILRGQLSEAARFSRKGLPLYQSIMMSRLFTNILTHPQFIAYRVGPKCLSVRICEWLGAMRVAWTARPTDDHAKLTRHNDAIIFEHYRPETHF